MIIAFNILGLLVIAAIVWWFWLAPAGRGQAVGEAGIDIIVDAGIYSPDIIRVQVGKPVHLRFLRKDPSPCAEMVIFEDLNLSAKLPVDKVYELILIPEQLGEFAFTCQMAMYRGKLVVE